MLTTKHALRIYLACTVRGDRGAVSAAREVKTSLERHGHTVLTAHLLDDDVEAAENRLSEAEVFARDMAWLNGCDALIAEASGSSFGVGFEVGYVLARSRDTGQRVYVLYEASRQPSISRLIPGIDHPACTRLAYSTPGDIRQFVDLHFRRGADPRPTEPPAD